MRNRVTRQAIILCAAAAVAGLSAIALAEAGSSLTGRSTFSTGALRTNPGGKSSLDYGTQFHTNPGGKYVFKGQANKFRTNPGMKYVYPGDTTAPH